MKILQETMNYFPVFYYVHKKIQKSGKGRIFVVCYFQIKNQTGRTCAALSLPGFFVSDSVSKVTF